MAKLENDESSFKTITAVGSVREVTKTFMAPLTSSAPSLPGKVEEEAAAILQYILEYIGFGPQNRKIWQSETTKDMNEPFLASPSSTTCNTPFLASYYTTTYSHFFIFQTRLALYCYYHNSVDPTLVAAPAASNFFYKIAVT